MAEGYDIYNYILESAEAVGKLIKDADEVMKDSLDYLKDKELRRVVVLGSGTSYHGVLGAKISMADSLGIPVESMYPIDFKDNEIVKQDGTLVIGVSQAGRSTSTIEALRKAKQLGYFTIAVTSEKDTPVAEIADVWMELYAGEELSGPKTKGFIVTIAQMAYFAAKLANSKGTLSAEAVSKVANRLVNSSKNIPDIAKKSKKFIEDNIEELSSAKRIVIVGCGPTLNYYTNIENAKHIALNRAIRNSNIRYDYAFIWDLPATNLEEPEFIKEFLYTFSSAC